MQRMKFAGKPEKASRRAICFEAPQIAWRDAGSRMAVFRMLRHRRFGMGIDMASRGLLIDNADNVLTLTAAAGKGETVLYREGEKEASVTAAEEIPVFHKMARRDIARGAFVMKYGQVIGVALTDIKCGEWVHTHNLASQPIEERRKGLSAAGEKRKRTVQEAEEGRADASLPRTIRGYRRPDGRFGIRNYVLLLPCSLCASETARFVSQQVPGCIFVPNQGGCSLSKRDYEMTIDTLSGMAANPNVYGTLLIGNGCEVMQAEAVEKAILEKTCKPVEKLVIRECGGSIQTMARAEAILKRMLEEASRVEEEAADISELILGTECGGSDPTSGLAANPAVGVVTDLLTGFGGTSILSETPEMIGAEQQLADRCETKELGDELLSMIETYEEEFTNVGENPRNGNPTPGNIAGGITTLEEKSLGCVHKSGSATVTEVIGYAKPICRKGLIVMDTPGQDIASIAGMAAAGAQVVLFTTGHGTPTGFGIVPVIKVTGNRETAALMKDHIDCDCSDVLEGTVSLEEKGKEMFRQMVSVACGAKTKAEELGFQDMSIARYCNFA